MDGCHLLFIGKTTKNNLQKLFEHLKNKPVLTVSDTKGYGESGVLFNLYLSDNNIRFEINEEAVKNSGLYISYLLMQMADVFERKEGVK